MAAPVVLEIPPVKRKLWAQFAAALVERAVSQNTDGMRAAFALLCKHCADEKGTDVLRRLCDGKPADIATTILAYLPDQARKTISAKLKENPETRQAVLGFIAQEQIALREAVRELAAEGKYPELRKVAG